MLQLILKSISKPRGPVSNFSTLKSVIGQALILRSTSQNIYENLALEDWFYQHHNFQENKILLFYKNDPCVVIGRHQNPWTEANVPFLRKNSISIARRNSGGGTVFHDLGNINISFMTRKEDYDRSSNLQLVCSAVRNVMDVDISVNKRDDIVIDGERKISGTAAKLGRRAAYHHCTLLVRVDTTNLKLALNNPRSSVINTNATRSIRSPVENLANKFQHHLTTEQIERSIAAEFSDANIIDVHPTEENFAGLDQIIAGYQSWNWIFGKSPKFDIIVGDEKFTIANGIITLDKELPFDCNLLEHLYYSDNQTHKILASLIKNIL